MSKYDRITTEELAVESLLAERRRIENAVYRSKVAVENAMESDWQDCAEDRQTLIDLLLDYDGQKLRLQAHVNEHGHTIFEDQFIERRLNEARESINCGRQV